MGFVHDEDYDTPDITIRDIAACIDPGQLRDWLETLRDDKGDIECQIGAAKLSGQFDAGWMDRARSALGFAAMGVKRVERRMLALGLDPTPAVARDAVAEIDLRFQRAKQDLAKASASAAFGRHLLAAVRSQADPVLATAIIEAAATAAANDGGSAKP